VLPNPEFRCVVLHNLHRQLELPRARELFGEILRTRARGYASEYPPDYLPFDAADFFGTHLLCYRERDGVIEGLGGYTHTTLSEYDLRGMRFQAVGWLWALRAEPQLEALEALLDSTQRSGRRLAYGSHYALCPEYRTQEALAQSFWELVAGSLFYGRAAGWMDSIVCIARVDDTAGFLERAGFVPMCHDGQTVPDFFRPELPGVAHRLYVLDTLSPWTEECYARHRDAFEPALSPGVSAAPRGGPSRSNYVLESPQEFQRLEEQSAEPEYDFRTDLPALTLPPGARILDAGCGSGIVSRYLAERYPDAHVTGFDRAGQRLAQAAAAARDVPNLAFVEGDLAAPNATSDLPPGAFAFVVCRFVLEHMSAAECATALARLRRSLAPGGVLCAIDGDGLFYNLHPTTERIRAGLDVLRGAPGFDLSIGRKLPRLIHDAGFTSIDWRAVVMCFGGATLPGEARRVEERLTQARPAFAGLFGGEARFADFVEDYLAALREPGAVLFYNRFVVTAVAP
jgi:SAM-dependent methyltransferase